MKRCLGAACILLFFCPDGNAQRFRAPENRQNHYRERWQFGFSPGANRMNFVLKFADRFVRLDSLKSVLSQPETGLQLHMLAERRLHAYLTLRFEPGFQLGQRELDYHFATPSKNYTVTQKIESNLVNFPVLLRLRSKRLVNFAAYMGAGGFYAYDVASQRDVNTSLAGQQIVRLQRWDYGALSEGGVDFFFPYVKMSLGLRMSFGLPNLLAPDGTIYSRALKSLRSQSMYFCLFLEG